MDAESGEDESQRLTVDRKRKRKDNAEAQRRQGRAESRQKRRDRLGVCPLNRSVEKTARLLFCSGLGGFDFGSGVGVFLGEAFDAACGVNQLLFASEERVAIRADFDAELVALDGRASLKIVAASAMHCDGVIVGVNTGFHEAPFCRVRSARLARPWGAGLTHGDGELQSRR